MGQHHVQPASPWERSQVWAAGPSHPGSQAQGAGASPRASRPHVPQAPHPGPGMSAPATGIVLAVFSQHFWACFTLIMEVIRST